MDLTPQGHFIHTNSDGYFVNPFTYDKIHEESKRILNHVINTILEKNASSIDSMYVRGSFANNSYVTNYSDIDITVIHTAPLNNLPNVIQYEDQEFRLDVGLIPIEYLHRRYKKFHKRFMLKTHAVCLYGPNRISEIEDFKASEYTAAQLSRYVFDPVEEAKDIPPENVTKHIQQIARALIRDTNVLFMVPEQIYTRDLVYCYQYFSKYYPEHESQMRMLVEQAIEPSWTKEYFVSFLENFGTTLVELINKRHS